MHKFGSLIFAGLTSGAIYAVFALLLTTLFRVSNILNLAIGDFAMLGVFGVNFAILHGWNIPLAMIIAILAIGAFAYLYDRSVLASALREQRPGDALLLTLLLTYALSLFIEGVTPKLLGGGLFFGPDLWPGQPLHLGGVPIERTGVLILGLAVATGAGFVATLRFSLWGKALAACGENALGARIIGIRQPAYRRAVFVLMCMLAATFGIVEAPLSGFTISSGFALGLTGILSATIAGFARPGQAVAIGIAVGLLEALLGGYVSTQYEEVLLYSLLTLAVLYRPRAVGDASDSLSTGALSSNLL